MPGSGLSPNGAAHRKGVAADEVRRHNRAAVRGHLHLAGPVSRSELAASMGLNRSTIADLVGELSSLRLVEEGPGSGAAGPGRPSPIVRAHPNGAVVLAVELAVDSIAVATYGVGGHVFNQLRVKRPREHFSPQKAVSDIANLARPLLGSLPTGHAFVGVGVAVAVKVALATGSSVSCVCVAAAGWEVSQTIRAPATSSAGMSTCGTQRRGTASA